MSAEQPIDVSAYTKRALAERYFHRIWVGFDQFVNVLGGGSPDDTISSRMQRWQLKALDPNPVKRAIGKGMCTWLGWIQKNHDILANIGDRARAQAEERRTSETLAASGVQVTKVDVGSKEKTQ